MLQFSIVQGSLKITNGTSTILLIAKKDISVNTLSLQGAIPRVELYNIQLGYTGVVFLHPLSDCEDSLGVPFTVNSFIAFAENNFGFTTGGGGGGSVTSVGLTMPSAFNVANSPITTAGDIAVTGAGLASQYVRGDGALASFPDIAGGGGGQVYYFNGGISEGTILGSPYYQMSVAANIASGVDFTSGTVNNVPFANFITDVGKPTQEIIPAGVWIFQCYLSASATVNCEVYATVEVYDGATFNILATSPVERLTGGVNIDLYTFTCAVPEYTPLTTTDRVAIRFYPTNLASTRTITLHTQDSHLSSVQTTFTTGIAALDGLTAASQYFQTGTAGSDFNINQSGTDTHVFNLPTATSLIRGALSSADWTTFNNKQDALGFTPANSTLTISTTSPLSGGGNLSANRTLSIAQSNATTDGYLSSVDWNTFNNKGSGTVTSVSALTLGTTGTDLTSTVATGTTTPVITLNVPTASASNRGALSSADWTTFNNKQAALVSTVNIKSINGTTILGSGDLTVTAGATIIPYNAYLNTVSGNNATAVLGDSSKPYLTMTALIAALPATIDLAWTINITGATTAITMPSMPPRDLIFNADAKYTYDFNFDTGSGYIITGATRNFVYNFLNGNINLKSDAVAGRSLGTGSQLTSLLTIIGWVNIIDWSNDGVSSVGVILNNSDLLVNELVKRTTSFSVFIGNPISLRFKKITFVAFHGNGVLRSSSTYPTAPVVIDLISSTTAATDVELTAAQTPINFFVELKAIQILGVFKVSYPPSKLILTDLTCTGVTSLNLDALITTGRVITDIPIIPQKVNSRTLQALEGRITGSNNNWASTLTIDNCRLTVTDFITRNAVGVSAKVVVFKGNNIIKQLSTATPVIISLTSASPTVVDVEGTLNLSNGSTLTDQFSTINYIANALPSYNGLATAIQSMNILT